MSSFKNKYDYKSQITKLVSEFGIGQELFEKIFAQVFTDIFEKETSYSKFFEYYKISVSNKIYNDIKNLKKESKNLFLLMFEDYLRLNNELNELIIKIKKESGAKSIDYGKIELLRFPVLFSIIQRKDLKDFSPELETTKEFLALIEENIDRSGIFFLYNLENELLYIGKSTHLSGKIIDSIWEKNIDGYVSIAQTQTKSDIYLYEPYYKIVEKPLLNPITEETDMFSIIIEPLQKSDLVKIYI